MLAHRQKAQKTTSPWCTLLLLTKPPGRSRSVTNWTKVSHNHIAQCLFSPWGFLDFLPSLQSEDQAIHLKEVKTIKKYEHLNYKHTSHRGHYATSKHILPYNPCALCFRLMRFQKTLKEPESPLKQKSSSDVWVVCMCVCVCGRGEMGVEGGRTLHLRSSKPAH